jgi:hypothetical protein
MTGEAKEGGEDIPVVKTCVAIGAYLAVSTNLRYQVRGLTTPWCWFIIRGVSAEGGTATEIVNQAVKQRPSPRREAEESASEAPELCRIHLFKGPRPRRWIG